MNWSSLKALFSGVNIYSSVFGHVWLFIVFIFRVLVFVMAVQPVWEDNSKEFLCNTLDTECTSMCYDHTFPISHIRLWALQLILITCLSLMVACYDKFSEKRNLNNVITQEGNSGKKHGGLWWTYLLSLIFKAAIDAGFLYILYYIYKGFDLPTLIKCSVHPCANVVDCYLSNPTEKKIFTILMVASSALYILMCFIEIMYLMCKRCGKVRQRRMQRKRMLFIEHPELRTLSQSTSECKVTTLA